MPDSGRKPGTPNKNTKIVKDVIKAVFESLQEDAEYSLLAWAKGNLTEFYKLSSKLIPLQADVNVNAEHTLIIDLTGKGGQGYPEPEGETELPYNFNAHELSNK